MKNMRKENAWALIALVLFAILAALCDPAGRDAISVTSNFSLEVSCPHFFFGVVMFLFCVIVGDVRSFLFAFIIATPILTTILFLTGAFVEAISWDEHFRAIITVFGVSILALLLRAALMHKD